MFEITRPPTAVYYQYDGMCTYQSNIPEQPSNLDLFCSRYVARRVALRDPHPCDTEINPPSLTSARNYEIIDRLQSSYAAEFGSRPLYDGRALLYSQRDITIQKVGFCRSVAFSLMQRSHLSLSSLSPCAATERSPRTKSP